MLILVSSIHLKESSFTLLPPRDQKNSSEFSYDRLGRVYGQLVQEGRMTRMADGLYPIGDTEEELLTNYTEVLKRAEKAGFTFKHPRR